MKYPVLRIFESPGLRPFKSLKNIALAAATVGSVLVNTGLITPANPWLATLVALITVIGLPGFLLSNLLLRGELSWPEQGPIAFVLGLGLLGLPAVLLLILGSTLTVLSWASIVFNIVLAGLYIRAPGRSRSGVKNEAQNAASSRDAAVKPAEPLNPVLLTAALLAAAGAIYLYWTTASTWSSGDIWTYLRYIRYYLDQSLAATVNPFPEIEQVASSPLARSLFNGWWIIQALLYRTAGVELVTIYTLYLPSFLLLISLLAFYSLAQELFQNRNAALLAFLVQIVYYLTSIGSHEWIGRGFFDRIIEDKFLIWLIILPVAQLLLVKYLRTGYRNYFPLLALSLIALALTHPMGLVQGGLSLGAFALLYALFSSYRAKIIKRIAVFSPLLLLLLLLPLLQRQMMVDSQAFTYAGGSWGQFRLSQTRLWVFFALENRYMAHPHLIAHPLTLLSILLTPLLIPYVRRNIAAQFLLANMAAPLLLLYNPLTAPFLGRLITPWMLWRVSWLLPVSLTVGFFLPRLVDRIQQLRLGSRPLFITPLRQLIPVVLILLLVLPLSYHLTDSWYILKERQVGGMTESERALLLHLQTQTPAGKVIMAPLELNTRIPAFTSQGRVLTFRGREAPLAREDIDRFYHMQWVTDAAFDILERRRVSYIIIERNHPLALQMEEMPAFFQRQYHNAAYELYQRQPQTRPDDIVAGNTAYMRGDLAVAQAAYERAVIDSGPSPLAYFGLGQVYQAQGRPEAAQEVYEQALAVRPDFILPRLALAELHTANGKPEEAISSYQAVIEQRPHYLSLFETLGDLYLDQDQIDKAVAQYQQAIPFRPESGEYYLALAEMYQTKGLLAQARAAYQKVISRHFLRETPLTRASFILMNSPSTFANPRLVRLITAYLGLAAIYEIENKPEQAMPLYQQAIDLAPDNIEAYTRLGDFYLAGKDADKAIVLYREAARRNLNRAWPHLELGELYLNQMSSP